MTEEERCLTHEEMKIGLKERIIQFLRDEITSTNINIK